MKILNLFLTIFLLMTTAHLIAQEQSTQLKDLQISIEKSKDGIKLTCQKGCAWKELAFKVNNDNPQAIDEYGMTEVGNNSTEKDSKLADFLFTVSKNNDGIELKGLEGTAWKELSFSLSNNKKQEIDELGMVDK